LVGTGISVYHHLALDLDLLLLLLGLLDHDRRRVRYLHLLVDDHGLGTSQLGIDRKLLSPSHPSSSTGQLIWLIKSPPLVGSRLIEQVGFALLLS